MRICVGETRVELHLFDQSETTNERSEPIFDHFNNSGEPTANRPVSQVHAYFWKYNVHAKQKHGCWSLALEKTDVFTQFTDQRLQKQLLDGGALKTNERIVRAQVRLEPPIAATPTMLHRLCKTCRQSHHVS
jgi:hypothetical protein